MRPSRQSRQIAVGAGGGRVLIGADAPVSIQTMWKEPLLPSDVRGKGAERTLRRIEELSALGCRLLRFAVPDIESAETLGALAAICNMPLVADIHFDYRIALRVLDFPVAKVRVNPGNIGGADRVAAVAAKAKAKGAAIRVGVNGGSLPHDLRDAVSSGRVSAADALVAAAERELAALDAAGFTDVLVSLKSSSVKTSIAAARIFAERFDTPLHLGVTEAGPLIAGVTRNAAALYTLLSEGLGDTVRVSLSDTMQNEVIAAREILMAAGAPRCAGIGVRIVSCPRCGRCSFDTHAFTERWRERLYALGAPLTVAVMGCPVNGPEEARAADIGITGAGGKLLIFRRGEICRRLDTPADPQAAAALADKAFSEELATLGG